ncbi:hypothetical protein O8I61_08005, partial [Campylobacter lari]|uniref:hypothetical protein n=1 Tax=Campylobacter lari TaxID=201 RepID=UPI00372B81EA
IIATSGGKNLIAYQNININGNIDANAGQNYINTEKLDLTGNITAQWGGTNYIVIGKDLTSKMQPDIKNANEVNIVMLKNAVIKNEGNDKVSENVILFKDSVKFDNVSIIGTSGGRKKNFISIDGKNNELVINSIKLDASGKNYFAKNVVTYPSDTKKNSLVKISDPD